MIDFGDYRVHIQDEFWRETRRVIVMGRPHPGAPRHYLKADGTWEPFKEQAATPDDSIGFVLPSGALEAIVAAAGKVAPQPATERHLDDAIAVRDRLLSIVEGDASRKEQQSRRRDT